jgi:hypothetical protein
MFGPRPGLATHSSTSRSTTVRTVVAIALLGGLTACSGSGSATSSAGSPANANPGLVAPAADAQAAAKEAAVGSKSGTVTLPLAGPALVRKASLQLVSDTVDGTAAKARALVQGLGGRVVSEVIRQDQAAGSSTTTSSSPARYGGAEMTLAVPAASLDAALDGISALGQVRGRSSTSEDVTATLADTEGRIATAKASIERVRALMSQTTNIAQIVDLEAALTTREADLESLQRTLKALTDQVAMSTITLTISPAAAVAAEPENGFLAGLASGWRAFVGSATAVLTLLGMTLPFLVLAGVIAWVVLRARRWLRTRRSMPTASTVSPLSATHETQPAYPGAPVAHPRMPAPAPSGAGSAGEAPVPEHS